MEEVTGNLIGETETLVATGMCGIIYGLFAVQPLSILAFTGPLLLFEEIVFTVCIDKAKLDTLFLPFQGRILCSQSRNDIKLQGKYYLYVRTIVTPTHTHSSLKVTTLHTSSGVHASGSG